MRVVGSLLFEYTTTHLNLVGLPLEVLFPDLLLHRDEHKVVVFLMVQPDR
jgi:hypothetical protein